MSSRGAGYNPEYHRINTDADHCGGTGIISTTESVIEIKAVFYPMGTMRISYLADDIKSIIGDIEEADYLMIGTLNLENNFGFKKVYITPLNSFAVGVVCSVSP